MNTEQLANKLVSWIRDRVSVAGLKGTVVGMSGGVDSSVLAVLCHRALPQSMLGLIMPCHSNRQDEQHAQAVADKFSIPTRTVVLDSIFDSLLKAFPTNGGAHATGRPANANLKARLRMLTLYYHANQLNYMVVGSGNKSELSAGYFTKYGDGGVDILPLGNLVKAQVVELASFLDIPQAIIDKPPSAGLWPGQTDEEEMGLRYEELDHYLLTGKAEDKIRQKIESMVEAHKHKLQPLPLPDF